MSNEGNVLAFGKPGERYPTEVRKAKRTTVKWEKATRNVASMGFIGSGGRFVSWNGKPLRGKEWSIERPYMNASENFQRESGGLKYEEYSAAKYIVRQFCKERALLAENGNLKSEIKSLKRKIRYETQREMTGGWTEKREKTPEGDLYVIENLLAHNVFKVGYTDVGRLEERIAELRTGGSMEFVMDMYHPNVVEFEGKVQEHLEGYNIELNEERHHGKCGKEWFRCSIETIESAIQYQLELEQLSEAA